MQSDGDFPSIQTPELKLCLAIHARTLMILPSPISPPRPRPLPIPPTPTHHGRNSCPRLNPAGFRAIYKRLLPNAARLSLSNASLSPQDSPKPALFPGITQLPDRRPFPVRCAPPANAVPHADAHIAADTYLNPVSVPLTRPYPPRPTARPHGEGSSGTRS